MVWQTVKEKKNEFKLIIDLERNGLHKTIPAQYKLEKLKNKVIQIGEFIVKESRMYNWTVVYIYI